MGGLISSFLNESAKQLFEYVTHFDVICNALQSLASRFTKTAVKACPSIRVFRMKERDC